MQHNLAIILVNWNGYALTRDCILSLHNTSYKDYTIIVVDNGSSDGSVTKLKAAFQDLFFIELPENLGFTGGNNRALQYAIDAGFKYSLLLNNDTLVDPDFLEPLLEFMNSHNTTGAVQPLICFEYDRNIIWNGGSYFNEFLGYFYTRGYQKKIQSKYLNLKKIDWITGCAFMIRNTALKDTGLLEETFFAYYEDADLSFRLRNLGFDLQYVPESIVYHIAGMSGKSLTKEKEGFLNANVHYYNIRNRIWFLKKYIRIWNWPTVLVYHIFYFSGRLAYFLVRGRWEKLRVCIKGIKDGLIM